MLHFQKFEKHYGNFPALKIDELTINPGIYWIKGVNGSGKSTLLKSIAGILSFKGDILLNNSISIKSNRWPTASWLISRKRSLYSLNF